MTAELVYHWVDPATMAEPKEGTTVYLNRWWMVDAEGRIAFYQGRKMPRAGWVKYAMPQCNSDERVTKLLSEKAGYGMVQIPIVYVPFQGWEYDS